MENTEVHYGGKLGNNLVFQFSYHYPWGTNIDFYNWTEADLIKELCNSDCRLTAVWKIKSLKKP
jgi:hypothetical protein